MEAIIFHLSNHFLFRFCAFIFILILCDNSLFYLVILVMFILFSDGGNVLHFP